MQDLDRLLTLADECYAAAQIASNPLMRAHLNVMGDDFSKQAEELQNRGKIIRAEFPAGRRPH